MPYFNVHSWDDIASKEIIRNAAIIWIVFIVLWFDLLAYVKNPLFSPPPPYINHSSKKIMYLFSMWHVKFWNSGSTNYIISNPSILYVKPVILHFTPNMKKIPKSQQSKGGFHTLDIIGNCKRLTIKTGLL